MARALRVSFPGVVYHVTSRGNARKSIYLSNSDRYDFLDVLQRVVQRYHWLCHSYCLMGNHYHFLFETPEANLSRGMRQLNGEVPRVQRFAGRPGLSLKTERNRIVRIACEEHGYTMTEVARHLGLHYSTVSKVLKPG